MNKEIISNARLLLLIGPILALLYTEKPEVRFSKFKSQYNAIHNQSGTIDLATIGSSRVIHAVSATSLQKEIKDLTNEDWVIYDMGINGRGMGTNYIILKELLSKRKVKRVLIEYNKGNNQGHLHFFLLASIRDLWTEVGNNSHLNIIDRSNFVLQTLFKRISKTWEKLLLGEDIAIKSNVLGKEIAYTTDTNQNLEHKKVNRKRLKTVEIKFSKTFFSKPENWELNSPTNIRMYNYIEDIIELTKEHDTELIFIHIVGRYFSIIDQNHITNFEKRFGTRLIQTDENTLRSWYSKDSTYVDPLHMSVIGSKLFSKWLGAELTKHDNEK